MLRRIVRPALAVLVCAVVAAVGVGTAAASEPPAGSHAGPPYNFITALVGQYAGVGLKNTATLKRTRHGYVFHSGQQDSHLVVTRVAGGLRFVDTGTQSFKNRSPARACERKKVRVGIAAVCRVPRDISVRSPLLVEVWPRLGNDYTNTSTLAANFAVTVLGDKGHDVARFGAGRDFFNGFSSRDLVWGGAGNDWIRPGLGGDGVDGGSGNDDLLTGEGRDDLRGGNGADRIWSGDGGDRVRGGAGADLLLCGNGRDRARVDAADRVSQQCESVDRR